jgi:nitrate/nitrite transporter NarK
VATLKNTRVGIAAGVGNYGPGCPTTVIPNAMVSIVVVPEVVFSIIDCHIIIEGANFWAFNEVAFSFESWGESTHRD